jgi:hypothetical protein
MRYFVGKNDVKLQQIRTGSTASSRRLTLFEAQDWFRAGTFRDAAYDVLPQDLATFGVNLRVAELELAALRPRPEAHLDTIQPGDDILMAWITPAADYGITPAKCHYVLWTISK